MRILFIVAAKEQSPMLSTDLLERVLAKLGLNEKPATDLAGLNKVYAAFSANVSTDNILKRIWLVGDQKRPVTGGEPGEFFESWLAHGTGGTCFPASGALFALLSTLGFDAQRYLASVMMDGIETDGNHGTVVVCMEGQDYLVDAQLGSYVALPLVVGCETSTGDGIHDIRAVPVADRFDIQWYPGSNRQTPMVTRLELKRGPVHHAVFLAQYALSALRDRKRSPFNDALFVGRHFPERILNLGRTTLTEVSADNLVSRRQVGIAERTEILIEIFGISPEVVARIPPDEDSAA
jgi:arylamine N-acetyltransferase